MRIAIDAMGGDHAPREIVQGCLEAAHGIDGTLILVGQKDRIESEIRGERPRNIEIVHASEVIEMDDKPTEALRKKKDSSISVCTRMVKEGEADAFVSAGNTGAVTAASLLAWRQIEGVHRPAIATHFPCRSGQFLLLDAGASPDIDPENLVEFAHMGRIYAEKVMGKRNAKVHLLNIGEEPGKGNMFAKKAYEFMDGAPWFAGNIEGKDMFTAPCDVVVCDAFVGNILLKTAEGLGEFLMSEIRDAVPKGAGKILFIPMKSALAPLKKKVDYAEIGGSPLLGLNGVCIICHGRSNAKAIRNAIGQAALGVRNELIESIRNSFREESGIKA